LKYSVVFARLAENDLVRIYEFIAVDSPVRAISFVRRLRAHCERLETMALRGPIRETLGKDIRISVFERRVTVAYRIEQDAVKILRLFYAGQDASFGGLGNS
jgi:toxin ParE1/3/4